MAKNFDDLQQVGKENVEVALKSMGALSKTAQAIAVEVERRIDDQSVATTTWRVADRDGVFVDFGQNARDRTIASAWSVRPTPDARVSAPLLWDEVADVDPAAFTVEAMPERVSAVGDPMREMWRNPPSLRGRFAALGEPEPNAYVS